MTLTVDTVRAGLEKLEARLDESRAAFRDEEARLSEQITKMKIWLWANEEHKANDVVRDYVALRDKRSDLKTYYENKDNVLKEEMEAKEIWLLETLDKIDAESLRTEYGTAYKQTKRRVSCSDWLGYWQYMKEHDRFDLVEKRVAQAAITKMIDEQEELPPGLNIFSERTVTIRRS